MGATGTNDPRRITKAMSIFHAFRKSYNDGSKPISRLIQENKVAELNPDLLFVPRDVRTYAYTLKQYRRLVDNIGFPEFNYGEIVKRGKNQPDSDPDCDDFDEILRGLMNRERIRNGDDRPGLFSISYWSRSRNGMHRATLILVADEHNDNLEWWIIQWDTGRFEKGIDEIGLVRSIR